MVLEFHQIPIAMSGAPGAAINSAPCATARAISRASQLEYRRMDRVAEDGICSIHGAAPDDYTNWVIDQAIAEKGVYL